MIGSFVIPIGELIDKLVNERREETAAIEHILDELDKIMKDQGILTYSIQEVSPLLNGESSFAETLTNLQQSAERQTAKLKRSIKVDEEMKQPLLLDEAYNEEVKRNSLKDSFSLKSP
jgi:hypothetical protein